MPRNLALAAAALVIGAASTARADRPSSEHAARAEGPPARGDDARRAEAKLIAGRGDAEFYAGRCDRAVPLWQEAEAAYHAPTLLVRIARCQALLGHVVAAAATLTAVVDEPLREGAPPAFYIAQEQAKRDLAAVRARIATLRVTARVADRAPIAVEIDGVVQREGATSFPLDPGEHTVRVRTAGSTWQTTVKLRDGEQLGCEVALWAEAEPRRPRVQRALGFTALGLGGAAVAVGLGFSVAAIAASRHADTLCGQSHTHCPPSARDDLDRSRAFATAGSGAMGGGAALVILGAVLLATSPRPSNDAWRARIAATPTSIGVRFDF